ncbi:MAG: hypothetical protein ACYS5V_07950 [Planctomycetota bacterium]|jgi:sugar lactone lactonase YvrE
MRARIALPFVLLGMSTAVAAEPIRFTAAPAASQADGAVTITFAVSGPTDVEVAIVRDGKVVRHLAAGVLGGAKAPPAPLAAGLKQSLTWDGRDDLGKPVGGGPAGCSVRVRAGSGVRFDGFIGGDPYTFGRIVGIACDEDGNVYLLGFHGRINQNHLVLRVFDPSGKYLREVMPFPADLEPDAVKDLARWDEQRKAFLPRNLKSLNPDFYGTGRQSPLLLVSASKADGVVLTDGTRLYRLTPRGAVAGDAFVTRVMWPRKLIPWGSIPNSGRGPIHVAISSDGRTVYLSGPYSSKTRYGHVYNPVLPPGRVYRLRLGEPGTMAEFVTIPVDHAEGVGGAWTKGMGYAEFIRGPVQGVTVDGEGRLYLCDRQRGRVSMYDPTGKELAHVRVPYADQVKVHPRTGAVYVLQRDRLAYRKWHAKLLKFDRLAPDAAPVASFQFGPQTAHPQMALAAMKDRTLVWVAGTKEQLTALADGGGEFHPVKTHFAPARGIPYDWARLAADYARDEIYVSDGGNGMWRYDGKTGRGARLTKDGRPFLVNDLSVGYDGLLYMRVSGTWDGSSARYSGPLWRLDRNLEPAPYAESGTHVLSRYIYSRYGVGYAERGIGVGPAGQVYLSFMYRWAKYLVGGFGPDGRPIKGRYMAGQVQEGNFKAGQNPALNTAVIGPVPDANGGLRVDLAGNIYVGMRLRPRGLSVPDPFAKDKGYKHATGCVFKFPPAGGRVLPAGSKDKPAAGAMAMSRGEMVEGAVAVYPELGPFSHSGFGGNTCCVCRVPRFDLDPYGRLAIPNAMDNSVRIVDNAGNLICRFGRYGNFDSGRTVPVPDIPLAWPTGAGFTGDHIYVLDTHHRRVVRLTRTHEARTLTPIK